MQVRHMLKEKNNLDFSFLCKYRNLIRIFIELNSGGYVGLFIGYTVAQLPSHLIGIVEWSKKVYQKINGYVARSVE